MHNWTDNCGRADSDVYARNFRETSLSRNA